MPFTEPSPVLDLKAEYVGVTSVQLSWEVNSTASNSYTFRIEVVNGTSVWNLTSNVTNIEITELIPGTMYNFTVFAVAADGQTEEEGLSITLHTSKAHCSPLSGGLYFAVQLRALTMYARTVIQCYFEQT